MKLNLYRYLSNISIQIYQYISRFFPASCRYYPSCSEYAKWHFLFNRMDIAFLQSGFRILKCNPFFAGGIDYPIISLKININYIKKENFVKGKIIFWIVPISNNKFYVIKNITQPQLATLPESLAYSYTKLLKST